MNLLKGGRSSKGRFLAEFAKSAKVGKEEGGGGGGFERWKSSLPKVPVFELAPGAASGSGYNRSSVGGAEFLALAL
ncbi:MAG: hypothetical protein B9S32_11960 [Verrucomicrobia bacterium Tous-C9LFEB]|nr:MAG: hypothetical protein B9S32_11960 [Verrucomicrobia bacterium Tous-C9LFEB]